MRWSGSGGLQDVVGSGMQPLGMTTTDDAEARYSMRRQTPESAILARFAILIYIP